jgi:two-component sensor histidine kinase
VVAQEKNDSSTKNFHEEENDSLKIASLHKLIKSNYSTPDSALQYANTAIELSIEINNQHLLAKSYNLLAITYYYKGDLNKSYKNLNTSLSYYSKIKEKSGIATCYNGLGVIYYDQGKLYKALQLYIQSLRIKEKLGDSMGEAMILNNIGNVYKDLEKFEKSLEYYNKSIMIKEEIKDKHGLAMTYNNIGLLYHNNKKNSKAHHYYSKSLEVKKEIRDFHGEAMTLNNIGLNYEQQKQYDKAINYYKQSIVIKKKIGDQYGLAMSLINIATTYREIGDYQKCYKNLFESERIAKQIGATTQLRDCYQRLYETYDLQRNTNKAYKYYKLYIASKDSMMSTESIKNLQNLHAQYEDETKQLTIQNLTKKEQLNNAQLAQKTAELKSKTITNFSLIAGLTLSLSLIVFFFISTKQRIKRNKELKKSLVEKEVLFKEVHHRVKNNFQVISSLLNLHKNNIENEEVQDALSEAKDRVDSMALVHEKLYKSADLTQININEYIGQLTKHLIDSINSNVEINSEIKATNISMDIETAIPLGLILNELITNSIKYAFKQNGNNIIEIQLTKLENKIQVVYRDNGIGFPSDFDLDKVETLGLNLVQILVLQIHGELIMKNENGASFSFNININK